MKFLLSILLLLGGETTTMPVAKTIPNSLGVEIIDHHLVLTPPEDQSRQDCCIWRFGDGGRCGEGQQLFINKYAGFETYFSGDWSEEVSGGGQYWWDFCLDQHVDGKVSARLSRNGVVYKKEFSNFESCYHDIVFRKLLNEKYFGVMGLNDLLITRYDKFIKNPDWEPPKGIEDKFKDILVRLGSDDWKAREAASRDLDQTGLNGAAYIERKLDREKLKPEQNSRLDQFLSEFK